MVAKRFAVAVLAAAALVSALALGSCKAIDNMNKKGDAIKSIEIASIDLSQVKDGSYEQSEDYGLDTAKVRVAVKGGRIEGVELLEHKHGPGEKHSGKPVIERVIEKQSLQVDVVSGATGSSKVVLKAIEGALKQGI
jgi:uncharacterized protein with FMN-binding domain